MLQGQCTRIFTYEIASERPHDTVAPESDHHFDKIHHGGSVSKACIDLNDTGCGVYIGLTGSL